MTTPLAKPAASEARRRDEARTEALPWVSTGLAAGVLGAAVIALFFLVVDWLAGRPLYTPHALGSALFLGRLPDAGAPLEPALILGYTALHLAVFIGFGVPAAFQVLARAPATRSLGSAAVVAVVLFAGFEVVFLVLAELFVPGLVGLLGTGRVGIANALAAMSMAALLWGLARRT